MATLDILVLCFSTENDIHCYCLSSRLQQTNVPKLGYIIGRPWKLFSEDGRNYFDVSKRLALIHDYNREGLCSFGIVSCQIARFVIPQRALSNISPTQLLLVSYPKAMIH